MATSDSSFSVPDLMLGVARAAFVQTKTEYRYPPAYLLESCPIPWPGESLQNIELANYASLLQTMLKICNSDKAELRNWSAQPSADPDSGQAQSE